MKHANTMVTVLVSVVIAVFSVFAWSYVVYQAYAVARDHALVHTDLAAANISEHTAEEERQFLSRVKEARAKIDSYVITPGTVVSFIEEVETLATHAKVTANIGRLDSKKEPLLLELAVSGPYANIAYYVALLESSPRLVIIDNLSLIAGATAVGAKGGFPQWTAQIRARVLNYNANPQ